MDESTFQSRIKELLARWIGRSTLVAEDATRDLLSAVWSFLRHPTVLEDRVVEFEERLGAVERRVVGDLKTAIEKRIAAAEEGVAAVEHRMEEGLRRAVGSRVAVVEGRLHALRARVVGELKAELRRAIQVLALGAGAVVLALVGVIFLLMAVWLSLKAALGAVTASFVLSAAFIFLSVALLTMLSSAQKPTQQPRSSP